MDWPHAAQVRFWQPSRPQSEKRHAIWQYPSSWDKKLRTFQNCRFFMGKKSGVLGQKRCFGVYWTRCAVTDLKQRQKITTMDHRNKIQSLILPTYDPGDAPDCMTEYGLCTCEYGHICHIAPTIQKFGFFIKPKLDLAFLVQPEPPNSMLATKYGQQRENCGKHPGGPKKGRKINIFF